MTNTPDTNSPEYYAAIALRAAAAQLPPIMVPHGPTMSDPCGGEYDASDEARDWLREQANAMHPASDPEGVDLVQGILDAVAGAPVAVKARAVAHALTRTQLTFSNEAQLQEAMHDAFDAAGVLVFRESILPGDHGRVDFLTRTNGVAIEVKTAGAWASVYRQLTRYADAPDVNALVLVTTKTEHTRKIPRELGGKPLTVVLIRDGFGVVC